MYCLQVSGSGDAGGEEGLHSVFCMGMTRTELKTETPCTEM